MRRKLLASLGLVLASWLMISGCGASDPVAADDAAAAAAKIAAAGSSRVAIVGEDERSTFTMEGVADYDGRRATFAYDAKPKSGEEAVDGGEFRYIGTTVYIRSSLLGLGLGADTGTGAEPKTWMSGDLAADPVTLENLIFPFPFIDPARLLAALEEVSGNAENLGEEDVRGVLTKGYRLTLDLERLIEEAPAGDRAFLRKELAAREAKTESVEIWIDDDGIARRVRLDESGEPVTIDFFDFGVNADIEAPPADQIEDLDNLFAGETEVEVGEIEEAPPPAKEDE